jgi:nucleoside phosphorylase
MSTARAGGGEAVDVLIVTAVADEWDAVLAVETGAAGGGGWTSRATAGGFELRARDFEGEGDRTLSIAVIQAFAMGKDMAVAAASPLLDALDVRCLAMCGVCGGRRGEVTLGDVIVADRLWTYDAGKVKATADEEADARTVRVTGDIEMFRLHPSAWKQSAERFRPDPKADWLAARPRSYEAQGDWLLERILKEEKEPHARPEATTKCLDYAKALALLWKVKR